ncbi:MAG: molybdopterin molybdotransferase MoeA [Gammaproteobacteria bacterium]
MSVKTPLAPSCADDHDPDSLAPDLALKCILSEITPLRSPEVVPVRSALGRVLAREIVSTLDVPAHTNAAMDGYALKAADLPGAGVAALKLRGTAWAGKPFEGDVAAGHCVRIFTGALMPAGADTVIMQEQVEAAGDVIRVRPGQKPGQNVRPAGEDIARGEQVLSAGKRLMPADLGLIASLGVGEVAVTRRPRVAFFSTGDELRSIGEPLSPGAIYDSNRYTLHGGLTRLGVDLIDMGVVRDVREALKQAFAEAAASADVLITTGGASVGEADYITETLRSAGRVAFWKVAIKPGRPLAFGRVHGSYFFGLPGNPVSVMATFYQLVQPALRHLMGETEITSLLIKARCMSPLRKKPGRVEYQRGVIERDDQGELVVHSTGSQGSAILRSMSAANCFIVLPTDWGRVEPGTLVDVQPFFGLV